MRGCLSPVEGEAYVLLPKELRPVLAAGAGLAIIRMTPIDMLWPTSYGVSLYLLVKMLGINIAFLLFFMGWSAGVKRQTLRGLALSVACLSLGLLNTFHVLSLPMMPPLITANSLNKAMLSAALSSLLAPLLMLIISFLPVRRIDSSMRRLCLRAGLVLTGICILTIIFYEQHLPRFSIGQELVGTAVLYSGATSFCCSLLLTLRYAGIYTRTQKDEHKQIAIVAVIWALSQASLFFLTCSWEFRYLISYVYRLVVLGYIYLNAVVPSARRPYLSLDRAQAQLRRTRGLRTLGWLVGHLAHELKNPLSAIRASAQLSAILDDEEERRQVTGRIEAEVDRLSELISITLEVGWDRPEMWDPVNMETVAAEVRASWDAEVRRLGIDGRLQVESRLPLIQGNARLLHRALTNLVANAVDAMPNGGELIIKLAHEEDLHAVRIEISDTGPGIPEEIRERIFYEIVTTKARGTGLGLMITYQIISELHHGKIWFETLLGQGTTFFVRLPIRRERHLTLPPAESTTLVSRQNRGDYPWDEEAVK